MRSLIAVLALCLSACASTSPKNAAIDYISLYYASAGGNDLLVAALLDRGAPVDAPHPDSAGKLSLQAVDFNSPLQAAAEGGHVEIVELLLKHKPWVDHRCCDAPPALGMAARNGHTKIVEMLLAAGADPTIQSEYGKDLPSGTPLDAARRAGHEDVARVLEAAVTARMPAAKPHP
ncbi:MAG: ankyrin repeat domain-containing protein [Peristeroidobacter soli]